MTHHNVLFLSWVLFVFLAAAAVGQALFSAFDHIWSAITWIIRKL